ncbi:MAG: hypothetical protein IPJ69_04995 [Deltaproteobacteria bacterium]|nr:MAG: hypothetical protein IPJ69_04995 [Deltaproteobacteria bacterium]
MKNKIHKVIIMSALLLSVIACDEGGDTSSNTPPPSPPSTATSQCTTQNICRTIGIASGTRCFGNVVIGDRVNNGVTTPGFSCQNVGCINCDETAALTLDDEENSDETVDEADL